MEYRFVGVDFTPAEREASMRVQAMIRRAVNRTIEKEMIKQEVTARAVYHAEIGSIQRGQG